MLSQSGVKSWETVGCYRKLQGELSGELQRYVSEPMLYGQYFENICLGSGSGKSPDVTDLPRLKNGNKSTDQIRIEKQAAKFKRMFDESSPEYVGAAIRAKQLYLKHGNIEGTLDMDCGAPHDLKLTADIESEWGYWSDVSQIDHLQSATYCYLYSMKIEPTDQFTYWVYDYSPKMNVLRVDVTVSNEAISDMLKRFEDVETTVAGFDLLDEYPRIPNIKDCRYCNLSCPIRVNKSGYNYVSITI